ncbi:hypothetical protein [Lentzea sp.]|uniref:hypothetical protein n=1 Tax=Lentzea sp. TaxID=56099 RepID=UPI002C9ADAFB|nr:hypothetical protein [Lentzea sp.]HUQ59072.1 hypothetical protein [Lentzea sp.]
MGVHRRSPEALLALQALAGNQAVQRAVTEGKFNIVGEHHDKTDLREPSERDFAKQLGLDYWREREFEFQDQPGDPPMWRALQKAAFLGAWARCASVPLKSAIEALSSDPIDVAVVRADLRSVLKHLPADAYLFATGMYFDARSKGVPEALAEACSPLAREANAVNPLRQIVGIQCSVLEEATTITKSGALVATLNSMSDHFTSMIELAKGILNEAGFNEVYDDDLDDERLMWHELIATVSLERSEEMLTNANNAAEASVTGMWKVGDDHIREMRGLASRLRPGDNVELTDRKEFNAQLKARRSRTVS